MRYIAAVEATSYLTLLVTLGWRLFAGGPDLSSLVGPSHGLAFLAYFVCVAQVREVLGWSPRQTMAVLAAAVVPLGGYVVAERLIAADLTRSQQT